jgi:adenine-specific DNA-methyltransferase
LPHITLKSIANNTEIDVIYEKWQRELEPLREALNRALGEAWEEWEIPREAGNYLRWPERDLLAHTATGATLLLGRVKAPSSGQGQPGSER